MSHKNIQVIDGAANCTHDVFEIADMDFALVFPEPDQDKKPYYPTKREAEMVTGFG